MESEHLFLVVHVDFDLLGGFGVGDGVAVADLDFGAVFAAHTEEGADDAVLVGGAAGGVVEDAEEGLRVDCDVDGGGGGGLGGDGGGREGAGEVEVVGRHLSGGRGGLGAGSWSWSVVWWVSTESSAKSLRSKFGGL